MINQKSIEDNIKLVLGNIINMKDEEILDKFFNDKNPRTNNIFISESKGKKVNTSLTIKMDSYKISLTHFYGFDSDSYVFDDKIGIIITRTGDTLCECDSRDNKLIKLYNTAYIRIKEDIYKILLERCFNLFI